VSGVASNKKGERGKGLRSVYSYEREEKKNRLGSACPKKERKKGGRNGRNRIFEGEKRKKERDDESVLDVLTPNEETRERTRKDSLPSREADGERIKRSREYSLYRCRYRKKKKTAAIWSREGEKGEQ